MSTARTLALALLLAGCPAGDDDDSPPDATSLQDPSTTGAEVDATTTTTDATTTTTTDPGATTSGTTDAAEAVPCTAIDFLFVVDNSSTMAEEQVRLSAAAPNFVAAVRAKLPDADDVHVGVISTDDPALAPSATRCGPFVSGLGFMTKDDNLAVELLCATQVDVAGSPDERPMEMLLAAVDDLANEPGGMNSDFVRKSSLLVVVLVTDEEDDHETTPEWGSQGDPADWFAGITAIKDDHPSDVVVLSLVGLAGANACPPFQWDGKDGAEPAPRLAEFTTMFPFARVGDVCAPSYDEFFFDAVATVADACAAYVPAE